MSIQNIISDLQKLIDPANIERAGLAAFSEHNKRIFEDGKDADGGGIGNYSTDPIYVNPDNSPRKFQPKGKTGKAKFKNGSPHVTRYFPDGYKGFRGAAGRPNGAVNLKLSGDLSRAYVPGFVGNNYAFGFIGEKFAKIAEGNEGHFGKRVFAASQKEIDIFINTLTGHL